MSGRPAQASAWARLHAALMPDYNRAATAYWWAVVLAGAGVLVFNLVALAALPALSWLAIGLGAACAVLAGLFPVRIPGTRQSFVASEVCLFLLLLALGPAAAALAAGAEALVGSWRTSRRWTSRILSPAAGMLAMSASGTLLQLALARWPRPGAAALVLLMLGVAAAYFVLGTQLVAAVPRLKRGEPMLQWRSHLAAFRWVGVAYAGSAAVSALLLLTYRQSGIGVLMAVVPVLGLLLLALHYYFLQQEAAEAMRGVAERAAADAAGHLRALRASERRFHSAFTQAAIGMALLDGQGRLQQVNPALRSLFGLGEQEPLPETLQQLAHPEDAERLARHLAATAAPGPAEPVEATTPAAPGTPVAPDTAGAGPSFQVELRCRHRDGRTLWVLVHGAPFAESSARSDGGDDEPPAQGAGGVNGLAAPGPDAAAPRLIVQLQDVSARRQAEAGLQRLAFHDSLTGLPNRRQFLEVLDAAVARARRDAGAGFALMFVDFDRFKLVNDSLGHTAGDELLVQLARRIQGHLRPSDVVARLGGDEFALLLPLPHAADAAVAEHDALPLAERLLDALRRPFEVAGHRLAAGASIGITFSSQGYDTAEQALRDADTAMYAAKAAGRGRWALFNDGQHARVSQRLRMELELRQALDAGALQLVYQPQFNLASGALIGFEALLRWQHPVDGAIGPAQFIPVAEESGLIAPLTDFVLRRACGQLVQWQRQQPDCAGLGISVNVSGLDVVSRSLLARVQQVLDDTGLDPRRLTLELTEDAVMAHLDAAQANLQALRALGVQLSVDDFGTGYSSLSRLAQLPIDSLKIDRAFVRDMARGSNEAAVVAAVVQLGSALRKTVVAEGIETPDQAEQLRQLGCGLGQGFHLARPLGAEATTAWLRGQAAGARPTLQ
ncbi:putative bifunctional diguanylate cyclase/phosphodiesterase [Aquabacterium sp. OR-4]|uniref:putative bifunctional diguanylate cyclase/phosphodiesterase n=1 Tax=Aquabacterium sp. OR-4 TaxID=2978127 RepID=UPI0028CA9C60|nr:EAL domain-containing protein [Aquabacterium sp. OR-4]MDT7833824.1 EAL domain-containing protein [Aquabacterium sp. OR-4]